MKNIILLVCFSTAICLSSQTFVAPVCASPLVQDEKGDLEKMIMQKIEERKKEMEAEKAEKAKKGIPSKTSPKSFKSKSTPTSNRSSGYKSKSSPATTSRVRSTRNEPLGRPSTSAAKATESGSSTSSVPPRVRPAAKELELTQPTHMEIPSPEGVDPNVKITFDFKNEEWAEILDWFSKEIGFGIYYGQARAPTGTHSYSDPREYTLIEALDKINMWLSLLQPSHVLVRSDNLLILINESGTIPEPILPSITPDQLMQYSEYEVAICNFDLRDLNGNVLATQLRETISQVHLDGFVYYEATNQVVIRERVRVLRMINAIIEKAKADLLGNYNGIRTFGFQHADPETALITIRQILGIAEDVNQNEDGSLRFSYSPINERIYLTGTPELVRQFEDIAAKVDVPVGEGADQNEVPYPHRHSVSGDVETVFRIVQTMLDGEPNVRMEQDQVTGDLYILASKRVHDVVTSLLQTLMSDSGNFDIVPLRNSRPSEVVETIEELLGIDTFSEESSNDPKLIADSENDRILVYGTPQQRTNVRQMIEQLDQEDNGPNRARRRTRVIQMSPRDAEDVINYLEIDGVMDSIGRKNRLNIIMPQDRERFLNRNRPTRSENRGSEGSQNRNEDRSSDRGYRTRTGGYGSNSRVYRATIGNVVPQSAFYTSAFVQEQGNDDRLGTVTGGGQETDNQEPPEFNVPGAAVEIRWVDQGIVIETDDLDAADDLEDLIEQIIGGTGQPEFPSIIGVEFRDANEVKALLDHILGLSASSGGGGGGGGGLMNLVGGAMSNAVGGAAGDALGGLLGGGGGFSESTSGAVELEGEDVSITVDSRINSLIVTGATYDDLDFIIDLVKVVDVDSPPHRPVLLGKTFVIPVNNRDPMIVKEKVEMQLSGYFRNAQPAAANRNGQNPEAAIQRAVLQQLQGNGGRRGGRGGNAAGGANNNTSEAPKATLGIDEENSSLLLTGPESIYEEVLDLVQKLDVRPEFVRKPIASDSFSAAALANHLKDVFGVNIEIVVDEEEEGASPGGTTRTTSRGGATNGRNRGGSNTPSAAELNRSIRDAVRGGGGGNNNRGSRFIQGRGR